MTMLSVESVSKRYGDVLALDDVSLNFPQGCITAIIGPSGCGKSTLLKLCNGLVKPDVGKVSVFGRPLDYGNLPPLRRRLGYAVQGIGLFPHLTAGENITLLASLEHWPQAAIEQRLGELLELTHLREDQLTRYPHQLSGGQQQRVGLCRTMMMRPEVLLLDEPFAAIDSITRMDIHQQLLKLHEAEPSTALLVTHDIREALQLAEHIVVMISGRVVCSDSKSTLLEHRAGRDPELLLQSLMAGEGE